jgi:phage gpG-like protein
MKLEATGIEETQRALEEMRARLANLTPVMQVAVADTVALIDDSFDAQASPGGAPWAPLKQTTIARRRKGGGNASPKALIDTGRLRQSITGQAGPTGFRFGTNVVYAGAQQLGNPSNRFFGRARAPIPARPFLPVERGGSRFQLMTTGSAGTHWSQIRAMVAKYIRTGEIS